MQFVYQLDNIKNGMKHFDEYIKAFCNEKEQKQLVHELLKRQWGMLSGGERNFLYEIILLSLNRDWYILDEPFAFVDENRKMILWKVILAKVVKGLF